MKAALVVLLCLTAADVAWGQSAAEGLFVEANQLYREGAYDEARQRYQEVVESGYADARVYYNLGNSCFKSDRLGEAIVWYERAHRLDPRDGDIRANLRFAAHVTRDRDPATGVDPAWQLVMRLYGLPSINEICVVTSLMLLAVCALAAWRMWHNGRTGSLWLGSFLTCVVLLVATVVFGGLRIHGLESRDDAIVTAREAIARSAPDADETVVFVLHEGTKVRIHRREGPWILIRLANGLGGWMPTGDVTVI